MFDLIVDILKEVTTAWREGAKQVRRIIILSIVLVVIAITGSLIGGKTIRMMTQSHGQYANTMTKSGKEIRE